MGRGVGIFGGLIGRKLLMAVTGAVLFGFVVGHLAGNLNIFLGPAALNGYSAFLKSLGELLWAARIVLVACFLAHTVLSIQVSLANRAARPRGYSMLRSRESTLASRTMMLGGPLIFLYVLYHLLMFTFLSTGPGYSHTDVYSNVVLSFQQPLISAVYIVAMVVLGFHLCHGIWSMLHTLGVSGARYRFLRTLVAPGLAIAVAAGYISIPVAVLAGWVR